MRFSLSLRRIVAGLGLGALCLSGCVEAVPPGGKPAGTAPVAVGAASTTGEKTTPPTEATTAKTEMPPVEESVSPDVLAVRKRIGELGPKAQFNPKEGATLTDIVIPDGSNVTADDLVLFAKISGLKKLQILNCRTLNDEMAATLSGLKELVSLSLTNSAITDATVEMIVKSFPDLVELDLSSNTNMTNGVVKILSEKTKLQRLSLVQNKINDIGAQRFSKLQDLRALDLRGNMEAGDLALEVVADLPKLTAFKHRSTAVTDSGMEQLARNQTIESLLIQDFGITDQSGQHLAKLGKLSQLELFRCQGFGSEGILALKGMGLVRLTLRDLPNTDDRGMEVFDDLPKLRRLYLHELSSVSDNGLKHLANLKALELLDIWTVPQMTDATVDVIAALPELKELTIRTTAVTDAAIDKILGMPKLQSLTFKENGSVTPEGVKRLAAKKWAKLDLGNAGSADSGDAGQ